MKSIYFDYNSTTPLDPRILPKVEPYLIEKFGNAASLNHEWGWQADSAVAKARGQIAQLVNSKPQEIFFTSGATESNNWALFGLFSQIRKESPNEPIHIITSQIEHSSILSSLQALQQIHHRTEAPIEVDFLPVNSFGQLDPSSVKAAIKPSTKLITAIWVNNEIGSINPIQQIGEIAHHHQIYFHTDATQAVGKVKIDLRETHVDLMSMSGHKIYGPKGIGGLFIRSQNPAVELQPLLYGGGQERGLRSGTLNVPGIVGLGEACSLCLSDFDQDKERITQLKTQLWKGIQEIFPKAKLNGHPTERSYNNLNITFSSSQLNGFLARVGGRIALSSGSACATSKSTVSHVLKGIGLTPEEAQSTLRLSIGRFTTPEDIALLLQEMKNYFSKSF